MSYLFDAGNERLLGVLNGAYGFPITLGAWIKCQNHPGSNGYALAVGNDDSFASSNSSVNLIINTWTGADNFSALTIDNAGSITQSIYNYPETASDGLWVPMIATFDGSGTSQDTSKILYTGRSAGNDETTTETFDSPALKAVRVGESIGTGGDIGGLGTNVWLAECAIWKGLRTEDEIRAFLSALPASRINEADLIAYWNLRDDASQTAGLDSIGALTISGPTQAADHPSPGGYAIVNSTGDNIYRTANLPPTNACTMMGWVYPESASAADAHFVALEHTSTPFEELRVGWVDALSTSFALRAGTTSYFANAPQKNRWNFVALVSDGTGTNAVTAYLFDAGYYFVEQQSANGYAVYPPDKIKIGVGSGTAFGRYAQWRVFDRALPFDEIVANMRSVSPVYPTDINTAFNYRALHEDLALNNRVWQAVGGLWSTADAPPNVDETILYKQRRLNATINNATGLALTALIQRDV